MILFLLLLIVAAGIVAVYATSGNAGTHDVTLWQWHWSAVPDWVPVVLTAVVFGGLLLLYMIYSGMVHGVRVGSMRRRVTTRESAITDLRRDNQRLREENARVRSELRGVAATSGDREPIESTTTPEREPVGAGSAPDRSGSAAPYRTRATFGERVRAFFSGREPAGY
ncbi:MAG: hypothetical protein E6J16_04705 [Chloroflexota bacterium]|nr:MAG: hypothetical protein E6J16_04705 [Chloroflexota bacterium]